MAALELISTPLHSDSALSNYWRLADTSADTGGHTLTNMNTATFVAGKFGNCLKCIRSSGQYLKNASSLIPATGDFSIVCWVNVASSAGSGEVRGIVGERNNANTTYSTFMYHSNETGIGEAFRFRFNGTTDVSVDYTGGISTSTWYHLAGVYDSTNNKIHLYVNGTEVGSGTTTSGSRQTPGVFLVGDYYEPQATTYGLDGNVDDLAILSRILTATEVTNLANGTWPIGKLSTIQTIGAVRRAAYF